MDIVDVFQRLDLIADKTSPTVKLGRLWGLTIRKKAVWISVNRLLAVVG